MHCNVLCIVIMHMALMTGTSFNNIDLAQSTSILGILTNYIHKTVRYD